VTGKRSNATGRSKDSPGSPAAERIERRTGEIGWIGLKRNNIGKGKERIEIYLAD
jgi:hypothetical protein